MTVDNQAARLQILKAEKDKLKLALQKAIQRKSQSQIPIAKAAYKRAKKACKAATAQAESQSDSQTPPDNNKDGVPEKKKAKTAGMDYTTLLAKEFDWAPQAGLDQIKANKELRKQYQDDASVLSEEQRTRAQTLLARDARKKNKKEKRANDKIFEKHKKRAPKKKRKTNNDKPKKE